MKPQFLSALIIRCEEPARIAKFYQDTLGMRLDRRSDEAFSCMLGATHFAIHGLQAGQTATTSAEIGFHIPDLDKFVEELSRKKIELKDPITDYPWARSATLLDPLGNSIYLMQVSERSLEHIRRQT